MADKPPRVYFIGKDDKQKVKKILNYKYDIPSDNFYYLKSNIIVVTSTGDDRYDESIVCHELDHAINSTFIKNTRGDAWKVGYATEVEDVISRGTALEEGLVYMDQKEFFCRDVSGLDKFVQEAKFDVMGGAIYSKYENLVKALAKGVSVFMGRSESNKFMDNLRAGRFDGKSRFRAEQTIDRVFGSGTSKNLMSLGRNEEEVLEFTRYLVRTTKKKNE